MSNNCKYFYLNDLIQIIEHAALDLMSAPIMNAKKADGTYMTMAEVANQNSMIAMENSGIKLMATSLIELLQGVGDDDDG